MTYVCSYRLQYERLLTFYFLIFRSVKLIKYIDAVLTPWGGLADGKPRAQDGKTPLHEAAGFSEGPFQEEKAHEAVVGALLKAGAAKDAKDKASGGRVMGESIISLLYVRIWIRILHSRKIL